MEAVCVRCANAASRDHRRRHWHQYGDQSVLGRTTVENFQTGWSICCATCRILKPFEGVRAVGYRLYERVAKKWHRG
jgi:hypothetical protein